MSWDILLIFFLLAVIAPARGYFRFREMTGPRQTRYAKARAYLTTIIYQWALTALTLWVVIGRHNWWPKMMGLHVEQLGRNLALGFAIFALHSALQLSLLGRRDRTSMATERLLKFLPESGIEQAIFVAVALTAAICEEIIYRGFAVTQLRMELGNPLSAVMLASALFGLGHLYQGLRGVIAGTTLGLVLSLSFVYTESLLPGMLAHFLQDSFTALVVARMLRPSPS